LLHLPFMRANEGIEKEMLDYEDMANKKKFSFGVLLVKEDQTTEDQWYSNCEASEAYHEFLSLLGDIVNLEGFPHHRAGLDTSADCTTGKRSLYVRFEENEVMFHVATCLPHKPGDAQQVERKRHLGNDVVVIVFLDSNKATFNPCLMKSHFNHVFIVVRPALESPGNYSVSVCYKCQVPLFGPALPDGDILSKPMVRKWLLSKAINGEFAAQHTTQFTPALQRSRLMLLRMATKSTQQPVRVQSFGGAGSGSNSPIIDATPPRGTRKEHAKKTSMSAFDLNKLKAGLRAGRNAFPSSRTIADLK